MKEATVAKLTCQISMSLDGFIAGLNPTLEEPLGHGGHALHEWAFATASWRRSHGLSGGESNADSEVVDELLRNTGATVMGRRMYSGGDGPWESDPNAAGWWGDDPPFHHPVFVLTHHARESVTMQGGTTFTYIGGGIDAALEQARAAAGDKDVAVAGGANVVQQYLKAGLLDELEIHLVPVLLGGGVRLLDNLGSEPPVLECTRAIQSANVTHLSYRFPRQSP
jgi:dihydrofolate reductase